MKQWKVLNTKRNFQNIESIITALLENRKVADREEFLTPQLEDVTLEAVGIDINEVNKTRTLVENAIQNKKAIIIYGDYDVDGICGTAILWETLYAKYKDVHPYIPHRIDEGYGLSEKGINNILSKIPHVGLIITVDNGIVAEKPTAYAKSKGLNVVITDHHTKGTLPPNADAIIHTTELCGTGVSYLLSKEFSKNQRDAHLELVALATVADLVPLNKYNRNLLKHGITLLQKTKRLGLRALFEEAKIEAENISTYHIGHVIAPRLNASGRISHALDSLRLICTKHKDRAHNLAHHLHQINLDRQKMTLYSSENAKEKVKKEKVPALIFVEDVLYEPGIIGLIASKLVEEFYRPSIAVSVGEKISKGSARSIPGVNIIELIRSYSEFLLESGGHPMAAGFTIETSKLEAFKNALVAKAEELDYALFKRELKIDIELPWNAINLNLYNAIQTLAPFGIQNPQPTFVTRGVSIAGLQRVGKDGKHLQMLFEKNGDFIKGIKFGDGQSPINVGDIVDLVYTLELNEWNRIENIELRIKDISTSF